MKLCIGIPCFRDVAGETLEDYMRFAYNLGRRTEHECFLAIKTKSEQFRARNAIVTAALQVGADYLLFLDDDHVIDWGQGTGPEAYGFVDQLLRAMQQEAPYDTAIVGALYYHRGGDCRPVLMREGDDGGYYYLRDDEITGGVQEVAVTGGGCMLIDMNLFSRIPQPWFQPEHEHGTDIQLCAAARKAGLRVLCDTSVVLGHVKSAREVVTPRNRHRIMAESAERDASPEGIDRDWSAHSAYNLYRLDVMEYLDTDWDGVLQLANCYSMDDFAQHEDKAEYYRSKGKEQIARQAWFHGLPEMLQQMATIHSLVNTGVQGLGLDFGCGSAPVGFDLVLRGHDMDFVDVGPGLEFVGWRAYKRGVSRKITLLDSESAFLGADHGAGPQARNYDYLLFLDSIEHLQDWRKALGLALDRLKPDGALITNYFLNTDFDNPEHVSMDHAAVQQFLVERGVYPLNQMLWMKRDFAMGAGVAATP